VATGVTMAFSTPRKLRPKVCNKSVLDNFDEAVLRRIVHDFYLTEKQRPTLKEIHSKMCESTGYGEGVTSLRLVLRKMGFRWKKTSDNRKFIMERHDIRSLRVKYLRAIRAYREEVRPIVYVDETYVHSSHTTSYAWDDGSGAGMKAPISKGHLITVHAGNSTFVV